MQERKLKKESTKKRGKLHLAASANLQQMRDGNCKKKKNYLRRTIQLVKMVCRYIILRCLLEVYYVVLFYTWDRIRVAQNGVEQSCEMLLLLLLTSVTVPAELFHSHFFSYFVRHAYVCSRACKLPHSLWVSSICMDAGKQTSGHEKPALAYLDHLQTSWPLTLIGGHHYIYPFL